MSLLVTRGLGVRQLLVVRGLGGGDVAAPPGASSLIAWRPGIDDLPFGADTRRRTFNVMRSRRFTRGH